MKLISKIRRLQAEAAGRKAISRLSDHMLRDIGLPVQDDVTPFYRF